VHHGGVSRYGHLAYILRPEGVLFAEFLHALGYLFPHPAAELGQFAAAGSLHPGNNVRPELPIGIEGQGLFFSAGDKGDTQFGGFHNYYNFSRIDPDLLLMNT
jgi:hypothetical protein